MSITPATTMPTEDRAYKRWCLQTRDENVFDGFGSPEGAVTAPPGRLYLNKNGGAGATLWIKESGTGDTGWVAV